MNAEDVIIVALGAFITYWILYVSILFSIDLHNADLRRELDAKLTKEGWS